MAKKILTSRTDINYTLEDKIKVIKNATNQIQILFGLIAVANGGCNTSCIDKVYELYVMQQGIEDVAKTCDVKVSMAAYYPYKIFGKDFRYLNTQQPAIIFETEIQDFLIRYLVKYPKYLSDLCDAFVTYFASGVSTSYWYYWESYNPYLLQLRLAILKNDANLFLNKLNEYKQQQGYDVPTIITCFPQTMDIALLSFFNDSIQSYYLSIKIQEALTNLNTTKEIDYITQARKILSDNKDNDTIFFDLYNVIFLYHFLRAEWNEMHEIGTKNAILRQVAQGLTAFLSGNAAEAMVHFDAGLKEYRKVYKIRVKGYPYFYGILHTLVLLRGKEIDVVKANAQIVEGTNIKIFYHSYLALNAFLLSRQNKDAKNDNLIQQGAKNHVHIDMCFCYIIAAQFKDMATHHIRNIDTLYNKCIGEGYIWLAFELLNVRNTIQQHNTQNTPLNQLAMRVIYPSLQSNLQKVEKWESLLFALSNLAPKPKRQIKNNDSRLVWLLDFSMKTIQAREQNYSKNAAWTAGKVVSLARLKSNELSCMTPQDVRVANRAIDIPMYRPNYATINFEKAIRELVGHPFLFLAHSPTVGVKLEEEKPRLVVQESANNYVVKFDSDFSEAGIRVVKQTPTHYKVVVVEEAHVVIKTTLGNKPIFIPNRAKAQLTEVLNSLSALVDTTSLLDATDQSLPHVEADARPYVHLLPVGGGIQVEFYVKPFGTVPPYFPIGEGDSLQVAVLDGQKTRTKRNLRAEILNKSFVIKQSEVLSQTPKATAWALEDTEQCLQLLLDLNALQANNTIVVEWPKGEKLKISKVINFEHLAVNIKERNDWFELSGTVVVDEETVFDMQKLLEIAKSNQQFVELSQGKFLALTNELRRRLQEMEALVNKTKKGTLQLHPLVAPALEDFVGLIPNFKTDKHWKEQQNKLKKAFAKKFNAPQNFSKLLRGYQTEGFEWLSRLADWGVGACLADDMGLGKTVQALTLVQSRSTEGATLVVAPASVCRNWKAETEKFAPTLTPHLFGEGDRQQLIENAGANDIIIVTYDLLQRESELFINKKFHTIILDEAQAIKNRQTKRSETAMQLQGNFKMIMTGTPLENHLGELWNLFQFINPGLLATPQIFQERFVNPIEKYKDEKRREQLKRIIKPFILRRRKNEVLKELPEKTEITLTVELSDTERAFYEALRREAVAKLEAMPNGGENEGARHLRILTEIMRLRRAACNPKMVKPEVTIESAKLNLFGETVSELLKNGHKALVFSQFVAHLNILRNYLEERNITYQYLDGQTPSKKRQENIEAFQAGEGDIFLISLRAGGTGLNLTVADYVIHMDPWWNPAVEDQASDRAHRFGQTRPVTVYRLVAAGTIEEKILQLHDKKRDLADSLLDGTDVSAKLSADDLMDLLRAE